MRSEALSSGSEEREYTRGVDVFSIEFLLRHSEDQYALHKGEELPQSACYYHEQDCDEASAYFAAVEIMNAEPS